MNSIYFFMKHAAITSNHRVLSGVHNNKLLYWFLPLTAREECDTARFYNEACM